MITPVSPLPIPELPAAYHEPQWYALSTCARHEKKVAQQLDGRHIELYLPLRETVRRWNDRLGEVSLPVFPGYVFVRIPLVQRLAVATISSSVRFVEFGGRPAPIPEYQIESVRKLVASKAPFCAQGLLKVGQRVRVRGGCLDGVRGVLVAINGARNLVVSIDLIRQSLAVPLNGYDVEIEQ